jgi:hypothetical protein
VDRRTIGTRRARLGTGLVDVAITYQPLVHGNQSIQLLPPDELILYALRPDNPMRGDPDYIYVDLGEDFHRDHSHESAPTASSAPDRWPKPTVGHPEQ